MPRVLLISASEGARFFGGARASQKPRFSNHRHVPKQGRNAETQNPTWRSRTFFMGSGHYHKKGNIALVQADSKPAIMRSSVVFSAT